MASLGIDCQLCGRVQVAPETVPVEGLYEVDVWLCDYAAGKMTEFVICPKCFTNKLTPMLKELGVEPIIRSTFDDAGYVALGMEIT